MERKNSRLRKLLAEADKDDVARSGSINSHTSIPIGSPSSSIRQSGKLRISFLRISLLDGQSVSAVLTPPSFR